MRKTGHGVALSLALVLCACDKPAEPSAPAKDIVVAPQTYQRMRFVSDIEQSRASTPARRPKVARHAGRAVVAAPDPMHAMMMHAPVAMVTSTSTTPEPSVVIAAHAAPETVTVRGVSDKPMFVFGSRVPWTDSKTGQQVIDPPITGPTLRELWVSFKTGPGEPAPSLTWSTDDDPRPRAFPLRRFLLPWAKLDTAPAAPAGEREIRDAHLALPVAHRGR